ncbi:hypothetical protein ACE2AJ_09825 [Aquihabitans daechungensis]|uniref:hypothetical protein n=1 Tax=Aquihabitans daechungensis TaxID=1052257 RepID=UPI003BA12239
MAVAETLDPRVVEELVSVQQRLMAEGMWRHGRTSLTGVLGLARNEVANTRVLRWILDPVAKHGIGADLIRWMSKEAGVEPPNELDLMWTRSIAEVSRERSRADVVLRCPRDDWTMVIEAKIDAQEGPIQAERLEADWTKARRFIFLTRDGRRIPVTAVDRRNWRAVSWKAVAQEVLKRLPETSLRPDDPTAQAQLAAAAWAQSILKEI